LGSFRLKKKILIVDDSEYNVELISSHLVSEGYDVDVAYDGETGLKKINENPPDLVLLDVMMPSVDGYEVCRRLKNNDKTRFIPVILITALSNPDDKVKGFEAGADDFLVKPLNSIEMLARIKNLLRAREIAEKQRQREQYEADLARELALRDVRLEEEAKRKQFYKDVVSSVTNGKLQLLERSEIGSLKQEEQKLAELKIQKPEDVGKGRQAVEAFARECGLAEEKIHDVVLCVSEATTNIIKHAQEGSLSIAKKGDRLRIWVEDKGPGIEFSTLPKAALMRGFSTKSSFGYGFKIMLELLDTLFLCTDKEGTTLLLEVNLASSHSKEEDISEFLSKWQG
jgi:DNA-binding response OmpR family regulator